MFRYLIPTILIGVSVAGFLMFTKPIFGDILNIKKEIVSYNEALDNAKALENERDKLTKKYNSITPENLSKLQKLLPDNVDNIRLILEIEKLASPYGMTLKDVKYESIKKPDTTSGTQAGSVPQISSDSTKEGNGIYGAWELEFSTQTTYSNFLSFLKDLENNLRIVDISSISFSSLTSASLNESRPIDSYNYNFKIKTYWLKN
jgi:hypothetical protein